MEEKVHKNTTAKRNRVTHWKGKISLGLAVFTLSHGEDYTQHYRLGIFEKYLKDGVLL
jgi:hypothetical protein